MLQKIRSMERSDFYKYFIIFNEIMKYIVKINKTYRYNVVIAGILFYDHLNKFKYCNGAKFALKCFALESTTLYFQRDSAYNFMHIHTMKTEKQYPNMF